MEKTLICNITMMKNLNRRVYVSNDSSIPMSDRPVVYPIMEFLEKTLQPGDHIKALLLVKMDPDGNYNDNITAFMEELEAVCEATGASADYASIDTEFEEEKSIHQDLLLGITDMLHEGDHILVDMTYGPKDLPVIVFTALNFAEKFLHCEIDNILYGQANFDANGKPVNTRICDMLPLFCLGSVNNMIREEDPEKARKMLKLLLSF